MIVIADDLTGANDTGVQFVNQGKETVVHLSASSHLLIYKNKVNVYNTDSRALSAQDAYTCNRTFVKKITKKHTPFIYKKIDSTLRGNIGEEIDGIMDELSFSYCAFVPAYPQNGRTTIGGYHFLHGKLLEDTELATDLKYPMTNSFIPSLLSTQSKRRVGSVEIKDIRAGMVAKKVRALQEDGVEIIVFDSASENDLQLISHFLKKEKDVLWVGSAGLAQSFTEKKRTLHEAIEKKQSILPTITVAGSISDVTRSQIAYQKERGIPIISIHPLTLVRGDENELTSSFQRAKQLIQEKNDVVLTTLLTDRSTSELTAYKEKMQIEPLQLGNKIAAALGSFASKLVKDVEISGLILTGGDIAYQTCHKLHINALQVMKEIEEGIPLSTVLDGEYAGLRIVTKAGAFGKPSSLYHAIQAIKDE